MTDAITKQRLEVVPDTAAGPYLRLPADQLRMVQTLLKDKGVWHWVDEHTISFDGRPPVGWIYFGRRGDAARVQAVLDGVL